MANEKRENGFSKHHNLVVIYSKDLNVSHICERFPWLPGTPPSTLGVDSTADSRQPLPWASLQLPTLCPQNNVVGRLCNECSDGSFHLSKQNPDGCLKCFCMGVSRQCSSSSWSRAQVPARAWQLDGTTMPGAGGTEGGHHHPNPCLNQTFSISRCLGPQNSPLSSA